MKHLMIMITIILTSSCSTKLKITGNKGKGIPVPQPVLVKIEETITYKAVKDAKKPELCDISTSSEKIDYISSGNYYYINFDPSEFAKGSFEINFNDNGLATKIAVNSEANTGVDSITGMLGTLLPFYKAVKENPVPDVSTVTPDPAGRATSPKKIAAQLQAENCLVDKKTIKVIPITIK